MTNAGRVVLLAAAVALVCLATTTGGSFMPLPEEMFGRRFVSYIKEYQDVYYRAYYPCQTPAENPRYKHCKPTANSVGVFPSLQMFCVCSYTCMRLQFNCSGDGFWYKQDKNIVCKPGQTFSSNVGVLNIDFNNGTYEFSCKEGYVLLGSNSTVCVNGLLLGFQPSCVQVSSTKHQDESSFLNFTNDEETSSPISEAPFVFDPPQPDLLFFNETYPHEVEKEDNNEAPYIATIVMLLSIIVCLSLYIAYKLKEARNGNIGHGQGDAESISIQDMEHNVDDFMIQNDMYVTSNDILK